MDAIIDDFAVRAKRYLVEMNNRKVFPSKEALTRLQRLDMPLQDDPVAPADVLALLDDVGSPATVASSDGRYFGFVIGGAQPASLAANLLAGVWDQNAVLDVASPIAAAIEGVTGKWLLSLLGLPADTGVGFVTGATMANFTGLAAARHAVLKNAGWDVEKNGLFEAPGITVVVGEEVHVSLLKALSMLGLGRDRVVRVSVDGQGRIRVGCMPKINGPTIVCVQAGNVNTGAFDPIDELCEMVRSSTNVWIHVDGAFGLWATAAPSRAYLTHGIEKADSWATDAHKWLNVPYDSGIIFVRNQQHLVVAMSTSAAYLIERGKREPCHHVPEISRRARGIEVWAALRSLGREGLADLIEMNCRQATRFAAGLTSAGCHVLNDVVLNQVLVSFGDSDTTNRVIQRVQEDGTCWCGGTEWQGKKAMRISVSSWKTTDMDVELALDAILRIAKEESRRNSANIYMSFCC
ncbi:MAG: aspartate aminotransferase family protein [Desulfobacteraceae bacterium]|nr:MAG: aspartate aminotransferase family protein [Desulfobacteraceae bacterium]